jgi:hypothetical protein
MRFKSEDRKASQAENSAGASSHAPGKTTRTSRLSPGAGIARKAAGAAGAGVDAGAVYAQATSGAASEVPYRSEMERGFGTDFSGVQAYKGRTDEMGAIQAKAATAGSDNRIAFASASPSKATVAHELAHVVQAQNGGGAAGVQGSSVLSQPGDVAERQADAAAATVAGGGAVDPSSLTARGAGIQREDVEVSAGDRTETESTTRVLDHGNNFEDQISAWDKLLAWKNGQSITFAISGSNVTRAPTDDDALFFFIELTPNQRSNVWMNQEGVLSQIFARFTRDNAARVMGHCDFPLRWKIIHWFRDIAASGGGRELIRDMIANSPLGQRLDAVGDEQAIGLMVTTFAEDNPENIFGDQIKTQLYPDEATQQVFDAAHPNYAGWRNRTEKLDAEARWAFIAENPVANIDALKSQEAMGGRNKWTSLIYWGPRGMALAPTQRENVDKIALTSGVSVADRAELFQVRWTCPLVDPGATFTKFKNIWINLQRMPLATISSDVVREVELRTGTSGGAYTDYPNDSGFGEMWVGTNTSLAYAGHTIRHEVGHAADTKLGGFANFSSKPPIVWKKWWTEEPWLQSMLGYMDAPTSGPEGNAFLQLMQAAMSGGAFASPFGPYTGPDVGPPTPEQQQQKVWKKVEDAYNSQGIKKALEILKTEGKHTANPSTLKKIVDDGQGDGTHPESEPGYIRDHYFLKKYGEHFSYHATGGKEAWANSKLRAYTLCSPYEYYADMFAAYFETDANRESNVPGWAAPYFKQLESMYDANAADDPNNRRSTAYGNWAAPQV